MLMRIMICDDNHSVLQENNDVIHGALRKLGLHAMVELYNDGQSLLDAFYSAPNVDYIFIDVEMPGIGGLEAAKMIRGKNTDCFIILLTAYERYAIAGYEVSAYRYLLKPLHPDAVYQIFKKTWSDAENKNIALDIGTQSISVPRKSILYAEIRGRKTAVITEKETYLTQQKLSELKAVLGDGFLRCHQSYIVNLEHCLSMSGNVLTLSNKTEIPVSRSNRQIARTIFFEYFNEKQQEG